MRPWTVNYFGALGGNGAHQPARHAGPAPRGGHRAGNEHAAQVQQPRPSPVLQRQPRPRPRCPMRRRSSSVDAQPDSGGVTFTAQVVGDPAAAIHEVWITYTATAPAPGRRSTSRQCVRATPTAALPAACGTTEDSQDLEGAARHGAVPADFKYVVQAANGIGLVSLDDNFGGLLLASAGAAQRRRRSRLSLRADRRNVRRQRRRHRRAEVGAAAPVAGSARDDRHRRRSAGRHDRCRPGSVTVNVPMVALPGSYQIVASFGGDANYAGVRDRRLSFASAGDVQPCRVDSVNADDADGRRRRHDAAAAAGGGQVHAFEDRVAHEGHVRDHRLPRARDAAADRTAGRHLFGDRIVCRQRDVLVGHGLAAEA